MAYKGTFGKLLVLQIKINRILINHHSLHLAVCIFLQLQRFEAIYHQQNTYSPVEEHQRETAAKIRSSKEEFHKQTFVIQIRGDLLEIHDSRVIEDLALLQ